MLTSLLSWTNCRLNMMLMLSCTQETLVLFRRMGDTATDMSSKCQSVSHRWWLLTFRGVRSPYELQCLSLRWNTRAVVQVITTRATRPAMLLMREWWQWLCRWYKDCIMINPHPKDNNDQSSFSYPKWGLFLSESINRTRLNSYIHIKLWAVIIYPHHNADGGEPMFTTGHGEWLKTMGSTLTWSTVSVLLRQGTGQRPFHTLSRDLWYNITII